jgi:dATP pyrophosphohydrolase
MIACHVARPTADGSSFELLQLRRATTDYMGGSWQIVRGRFEGTETAWQAALRELHEETGLSPREFYKLSHMEVFYLVIDETIWHCPGFIAIVGRDQPVQLNDEHDAFRWISIAEAHEQYMWPGERQSLAEIEREIFGNGLSKQYLNIALSDGATSPH